MNQNKPRPLVRRLLSLLLTALVTAVITGIATFYVAGWLQGNSDLEYYETDDSVASVGVSQLQQGMKAYVERLEYEDSAYASLRVINYIIANVGNRSSNEPVTFYFVRLQDGRTSAIDEGAVVDVNWTPVSQTEIVPLFKRTNEPGIGPGFTVWSTFLGKSQIRVSLVLDVYKYPDLRNAQIAVGKKAGPAILVEKAPPPTFALSFTSLLVIVFVVASVAATTFGTFWMLANLRLGNYTAGARIWDSLFDGVGLGRPFKKHLLRSEKASGEPKRDQSG